MDNAVDSGIPLSDVEALTISLGLVAREMSFDQISRCIRARRYELLGRTKTQLEEYMAWMSGILEDFASIGDYVRHVVFKMDIVEVRNFTCA